MFKSRLLHTFSHLFRPSSKEPLDSLLIHPESYALALKLLANEKFKASDIGSLSLTEHFKKASAEKLAKDLSADSSTLSLIIDAFANGVGHDLRWSEGNSAVFRSDVLSFDDIKRGQKLTGKVMNVVPFGAFVDVGVGRHGLIHRSKMNALPTPALGQKVQVLVLDVNQTNHRIAFELLKIMS
jgi:uncharacterized protein